MRGRLGLRARWAVVAVMVGAALAACGDDKKDTATVSQTTAAPATDSGTISLQAGLNDKQDPTIVVTEFLPEVVNVSAGGTVEWRIAAIGSRSARSAV